jgi:hypothetical protein
LGAALSDTDAFDDADDEAWIRARIVSTKALILAHEAAILALSTGGAQSYQLDTGQTRQLVTKAHLGSLELALKRLEARLSTLQQKLGKARFYVRPGW